MFRNVTGYDADIYFKGSSIFFGYQAGLSYEIFEYLSVFAGIRYVSAKNTYQGHVKDITINAEPSEPPSTVYYDIPAGSYTPGNYLREVAGAMGLPVSTVNLLNGTAAVFDALTGDMEADVEETGNGYTPIIGANITVAENFNIGLKYEFKTKLDLTTKVIDGKDAGGMFVQDSIVHSDMPAMLSAGISWEFVPYWTLTAGAHYYFDRNANYGKTLDATGEQVSNDLIIDKNYFEIGAGLEFAVTNDLFISGGYLFAKPGVSEDYQSDLSFGLTSSTLGIGAGYRVNDTFMLNIGGSYTFYNEGSKSYNHIINSPSPAEVNGIKQTYNKSNLIFAIGLDISL